MKASFLVLSLTALLACLSAPALADDEVFAIGSAFGINAAEAGLRRFTATPVVMSRYVDGEGTTVSKRAARVLTRISTLRPAERVACAWELGVPLYHRPAYRTAMRKGVSTAAWLAGNPDENQPLKVSLLLHAKKQGLLYRDLGRAGELRPPVITAVSSGDTTTELVGNWFGTRRPLAWLEYLDARGGIARIRLSVATGGFADAEGRAAHMCPETGFSRVVFLNPRLPRLIDAEDILCIVIDNGYGLAAWDYATSPRQAISGTVSGDNVDGVTVTISGDASRFAVTGPDGAFSVGGLPDGDFTVTPSKRSHAFDPPSRTVALAGAESTGHDFTAVERRSFVFWYRGHVLHFPYYSSLPLDTANADIERLLVAIHSSSYNPLDYLKSGVDSAALVPGASASTLVIAPHFLIPEFLPDDAGDRFLHWGGFPFWGTESAIKGVGNRAVNISAFTVLDLLLTHLVEGGRFPNLARIVIAGHSAGGQMVNRYSASNHYDVFGVKPTRIAIRYVVMGPKSYMYLDGNRAVAGTVDNFAIPTSPPSDYNAYGYGMDGIYSYLAATGEESIRNLFQYRDVCYLVGENDNVPDPADSATALLQGPERRTRSEIFYNYLGFYYGNGVYDYHQRSVVPGVGHSGRGQMLSPEGLAYLYDLDP